MALRRGDFLTRRPIRNPEAPRIQYESIPRFPLEAFPTEPGIYIDEQTTEADNFEANLDVLAGYAMLDIEPVSGLRLIGGVRVSEARQKVRLIPKRNGGSTPEDRLPFGQSFTIDRSFRDLLPGFSMQVALSEDMDMRIGYGRTLGRPQFRELVPFSFQPRPGAPSIQGNPDLERTIIENVDARWSYYPVPTSLFSIGGFFKRFDGPVEPLSGTGGRFINTGKANTYGIEGEVRLPFGLLSQKISNWALRLNLTLLRTEAGEFFFVQLPDDPADRSRSIFIPAGNRPLFGQTPLLFNAGLTYQTSSTRTSATVLYRYTGEQLRFLRSNGLRTFKEPLSTLDVILSQKILSRWTFGFEVRNIIGTEISYLTELPDVETVIENNVVNRREVLSGEEPSVQEFYDRGRSVEVSLSWSFN